jgi:hypothetical protein
MLHSKKYPKTPPEKPFKKYIKLSHFALKDPQKDPLKDPLKDTNEESEAGDELTSNVHQPNVVVSTARIIKISFLTIQVIQIHSLSTSDSFRSFTPPHISLKPSTINDMKFSEFRQFLISLTQISRRIILIYIKYHTANWATLF